MTAPAHARKSPVTCVNDRKGCGSLADGRRGNGGGQAARRAVETWRGRAAGGRGRPSAARAARARRGGTRGGGGWGPGGGVRAARAVGPWRGGGAGGRVRPSAPRASTIIACTAYESG